MYQLMKMNNYKMLRDRTMWSILILYSLFVLWINMPRGYYQNFVYTGRFEALGRAVQDFYSPFSEREVNLLDQIRRKLVSLQSVSVFLAYCLIYFRREKKGLGFERICAVSRTRVRVYLSNLITLFISSCIFAGASILILLIHIVVAQRSVVCPPMQEFIIFFAIYICFIAMLITLMYSIYLISQSVLLPVILVVLTNAIGIIDTVTQPIAFLHAIVSLLDFKRYLGELQTIRNRTDAFGFILFCLIVSVFVIVITSIVISNRDLKWGEKK